MRRQAHFRFVLLFALPALTGADCVQPQPNPDGGGGTIARFTDEVWTWDQTRDACSYSNNGNGLWDWMMEGREPVQPGRYPVFIYLVGTGDTATSPVATSIVESMAARGYVAASVPYASLDGIGLLLNDPDRACEVGTKKATCLFGSGTGSAITRLCARPNADCDRGIVIAGHSQGAMLATVAKNHDSRVRAVFGMGLGVHEHISVPAFGIDVDANIEGCALPANRALPTDRLRIVNGESEYVYSTHLGQDMQDLSGMSCAPGSLECLRADGSGWVFFPDAASQTDHDETTGELVARHCYFANSPPGDCGSNYMGLNTNWESGTAAYAREPSLTWLSSFTD